MKSILHVFTIAGLVLTSLAASGKPVVLLNVSYDPTRELYADYDALFAADWKKQTGNEVKVTQSHGGSGKRRAR